MKITDALIAEHTIFRAVFDQIERVLPDLASLVEIRTLASIIEGLLRSHADTETNLAYLALDHALAQNGQLQRMHQDHHEIDARLENVRTAGTCAAARRLLKLAIQASREHFEAEERGLFPLLEQVLQEETLSQLGLAWQQRLREPAAEPVPVPG